MIGIIIAVVLRGIFIAVGAAAIENYTWVFYLFGAFLIYTAVKLAREGESDDDEYHENRFMRFVERRFPATQSYHGTKLFILENGKRLVTPMFIVIVALGTTDLLFALDSIPAIYGLTKEPYLVLTANIFALMGLRQLYFLIGGLLKRLVYLSLGLAVLLAFIGVKLLLHALHTNEVPFLNGGEPFDVPEIPIGVSSAPSWSSSASRPWPACGRTAATRGWSPQPPDAAAAGSFAVAGAHDQGAGRDDQGHADELLWCQALVQYEQASQRRGRGFEGEQDSEDSSAEPPQGDQLQRVGQYRGEQGDPQALGDHDGGPQRRGGQAERRDGHQRDGHGQSQAVQPVELGSGPTAEDDVCRPAGARARSQSQPGPVQAVEGHRQSLRDEQDPDGRCRHGDKVAGAA